MAANIWGSRKERVASGRHRLISIAKSLPIFTSGLSSAYLFILSFAKRISQTSVSTVRGSSLPFWKDETSAVPAWLPRWQVLHGSIPFFRIFYSFCARGLSFMVPQVELHCSVLCLSRKGSRASDHEKLEANRHEDVGPKSWHLTAQIGDSTLREKPVAVAADAEAQSGLNENQRARNRLDFAAFNIPFQLSLISEFWIRVYCQFVIERWKAAERQLLPSRTKSSKLLIFTHDQGHRRFKAMGACERRLVSNAFTLALEVNAV